MEETPPLFLHDNLEDDYYEIEFNGIKITLNKFQKRFLALDDEISIFKYKREKRKEIKRKYKRVISHSKPFHLDDILAVSLIKFKYPKIKHIPVDPQSKKLDYYKNDRTTIIVDVGNEFNPKLKHYDHHINDNNYYDSAFMQVLKYEFTELYIFIKIHMPEFYTFIRFIDYKDNNGYINALKEFDLYVDLSNVEDRSNVINTKNLGNLIFGYEILLRNARYIPQFIAESLIEYVIDYRNSLVKANKNSNYTMIDNYGVAYTDEIMSPTILNKVIKEKYTFISPKIDVSIVKSNKEYSDDTPRYAIKLNPLLVNNGINLKNITKKFDESDIEFIHRTGFLAVIKSKELDEDFINKIIELLKEQEVEKI